VVLSTLMAPVLKVMPIRPCPQCQTQTARVLDAASALAHVWYYRCDACGHVWNVPKTNPDGPIVHVTVPPNDIGGGSPEH